MPINAHAILGAENGRLICFFKINHPSPGRAPCVLAVLSLFVLFSCAGKESYIEKPRLPDISEPKRFEPSVRVLIKKNLLHLTIGEGDYVVKTGGGNIVSRGERTLTFRSEDGYLFEGANRFKGELQLVSRAPVSIDGVLYSGKVVFYPSKEGIDLIDQIGMERYVASVLKSEIPSSFNLEAKKALAVAVRTYTLYRMENGKNGYYHLDNSNISQVYGGVDGVGEEYVRAARDTQGTVVMYHGGPALTVYHATCGGKTENAYDAWQTDVPYLRAVSCGYCDYSPGFRWVLEMTPSDFMNALKKGDIRGNRLISLSPVDRTKTGRAKRLRVVMDTGTWEVDSSKLRADVGYAVMKSISFSISMTEDNVSISGKGYGHGVGFCQYGADGMAKRGFRYREILTHYYGNEIDISRHY
jgi:stage II sporulation protein D